tara:strand:- start:14873 stop:15787 length:915 start_codon:yes stop_codon:yes gene_type:complete
LADNRTGAAKAYAKAQSAELSEDFSRAAALYEMAYRMKPSAAALRSATKARYAAKEFSAAATLSEELLRNYPDDKSSTSIADQILSATTPSLTRLEVECSTTCVLQVNGVVLSVVSATEHIFYVSPGPTEIAADFDNDGTAAPQRVDGVADTTVKLSLVSKVEAEPLLLPAITSSPALEQNEAGLGERADVRRVSSSRNGGGISKVWFVTGAVLTVGLGGATVWSGLDVLDSNKQYKRSPTQERLDDGRSKELRTNVLIGATSVFAIATVATIFVTNWSEHGEQQPLQVFIGGGGGALGYVGSF